jgi:DUF2075 family protein
VLVYLADKGTFLDDNDNGEIDEIILRRFKAVLGRSVGPAERRSWRESLGRVANILRDDGIPQNVGVGIEFQLPQSSKRIDVTLTGRDANASKQAVIVELKQWESAAATSKDAIVETFVGRARREVVHPSYQAWSYATLLEGFNTAVSDGGIAIRPCAYLHNYTSDGQIDAPHYHNYIDKAPLFLKGDVDKERLRGFIKQYVKSGDNQAILRELQSAKIRPSKYLADALGKMLKGASEFVLIDDQKTVYEAALVAAKTASVTQPNVVMVHGGPGTGKSVVAINLLVALTAKGLNCRYVSRNAAPRAVYKAKLTGSMRGTRFDGLFLGSGSFVDAPANDYDVLIVDEAHRLNEKSGFYGNQGDNQIDEIIRAAKCAVFFLDEDQRVTLKDIGSRDLVREFAFEKGAEMTELSLTAQFRCNGSEAYLSWLDHALGIRESANPLLSSSEFDFRVFDSPSELHAAIEARNIGNKARVVAGYCWAWKSKTDPSAFDIAIGDYRKRWNLDAYGSLWIIDANSIDEVGCIHTCQGLEVDYVGVIVGPDFLVRDGQVVTVPEARAKQDKTIQGYKALAAKDPHRAAELTAQIIKNTYRTLMTRGMKGCYVHCTDAETNGYFKRALAL